MAAIFKREARSYFTGMMGYVIVAVMLALTGLYFANVNLISASPDFGIVMYSVSIVILFVVPAITMRSFAEERRSKTDQLLLTSPVSLVEIVLGKYLAELLVFAIPLVVACFMPLLLSRYGAVSLAGAYVSIFGYFLVGAACISIGTWVSALLENQIIAYLATLGLLLGCYLMNGIKTMFTAGNLLAFLVFCILLLAMAVLIGVSCKSAVTGAAVFAGGAVALFVLFQLRPVWLLNAFNAVLTALGLFDPFFLMVSGMFSLNAVVYYLSTIGIFLFLTVQALERRRWA